MFLILLHDLVDLRHLTLFDLYFLGPLVLGGADIQTALVEEEPVHLVIVSIAWSHYLWVQTL